MAKVKKTKSISEYTTREVSLHDVYNEIAAELVNASLKYENGDYYIHFDSRIKADDVLPRTKGTDFLDSNVDDFTYTVCESKEQ